MFAHLRVDFSVSFQFISPVDACVLLCVSVAMCSLADMRKYMDTRELIRRDKELHRLDLRNVSSMPQQVIVDILTVRIVPLLCGCVR